MSDTTRIEMTEQQIIEWLCELAIDGEDLPAEFTISPGEPEPEEADVD